jgi:hypothetical protein
MKPSEIAARFAAFVWYTNCRQAQSRTIQTEARRFSDEDWHAFLPVANEGWGRLLLQVAKTSATAKRPTRRQLPVAV